MAPDSAPLSIRTPAFLVDQLVVLGLGIPPALISGVGFDELVSPGQTRTIVFLVLMAVAFGYHFLAEWLTGRTVGKQLFGLAVVADDGTALGIRGSLVRNALRLVDGLGYWSVAVAVIWYRGDGKRIGDVAGKTVVVRTP